MSKLPAGWAAARIGSLCSLENGRAFKPTEWATSGLPIVRIQNLNNPLATYNHFAGVFADRYHLHGGELLFAWSGTPGTSFGAHVWKGGEAVLNQHIFRVDFDEAAIDKRFFRFAINQKLNELIDIAHGGVGLRHVTKGKFENTEVALAPLHEQTRIADKLDAVLAQVDACRDRLDRVPGILKRFRQSVLAAATSGKLTQDWRADQGARMQPQAESGNVARDAAELRYHVTATPDSAALHPGYEIGWRNVRLADIADIQGGVTKDTKKQSPKDEEVPYLRVANVQRGHLDLTEIKTIRVPLGKLAGLLLEPGDILFNEGGDIDKLGRGWIWEGQIQRCTYQNHVFRARLLDKVNQPKYISWWGNFRGLEYFLRSGKQTTNLASINKSMLSNLPISLPPPSEQSEIVRRVESLFAYADRLETRYKTARAQVEKLTPALLAKAFCGELVPQDPNDEPAEALLARLRAARSAQPTSGKRRRQASLPVRD
jgi:type I restriction enzyme S subunit